MTLGLSHVALGGALMAALAGVGGFAYGTRVGTAMEQAAQHRAEVAADKIRRELQAQNDASGTRHQSAEYARQAQVREIYRETNTITERNAPVYTATCVDAAGVGLLDRAAATANGKDVAASAGGAGDTAEGSARP